MYFRDQNVRQRPLVLMELVLNISKKAVSNLESRSIHTAYCFQVSSEMSHKNKLPFSTHSCQRLHKILAVEVKEFYNTEDTDSITQFSSSPKD